MSFVDSCFVVLRLFNTAIDWVSTSLLLVGSETVTLGQRSGTLMMSPSARGVDRESYLRHLYPKSHPQSAQFSLREERCLIAIVDGLPPVECSTPN